MRAEDLAPGMRLALSFVASATVRWVDVGARLVRVTYVEVNVPRSRFRRGEEVQVMSP